MEIDIERGVEGELKRLILYPTRHNNNQCLNCAYLGLCLRKKALVEEKLVKVEELAVHG